MRKILFIPVDVNALMNLQWSLHLAEVLIWLKSFFAKKIMIKVHAVEGNIADKCFYQMEPFFKYLNKQKILCL